MNYEIQNQYGVLTVTEPDSPREIRFITPEYREQFRIRDGQSVLLSANGTRREVVCRYLDDYHWYSPGAATTSANWHKPFSAWVQQ